MGEDTRLLNGEAGSRLECKFPYNCRILENNHIAAAIYTAPDFILLKANQKYLSIIENPYDKSENSIGKHVSQIFHGWAGSPLEKAWNEAAGTQSAVCAKEVVFCGFKKGPVFLDSFVAPLSESEEIKYILNIMNDETERVKEKLALQEQNKQMMLKKKEIEEILKIKDEFFSFISHEFKTPLTVINAAIQTMELVCGGELSAKGKKYMKRIKQNSLRLLRLINNLLDITKTENGYMKINRKNIDVVTLTKEITESVMPYANKKGVELGFSSSLNSLTAGIDDEKFERILLNLLSNAIKFTSPGKSVNVKLSAMKTMLCIEVEDEGPGIPAEKQELIFDRFSRIDNNLTRSTDGTGIGLALVKLLVNAMGGEIKVKSEEGKGSNFMVLLPASSLKADEINETAARLNENRTIQVAIEFSDIYMQD